MERKRAPRKPILTTVTSRKPIRSKRTCTEPSKDITTQDKQAPAAISTRRPLMRSAGRGDMSIDCEDATRPRFKFPRLDFGRPEMDRCQLKRTLGYQLYTYDDYDVHTDIVHADYQDYRLAFVSWYAKVLPSRLRAGSDNPSVFIPAVALTDRYISARVAHGEELGVVMKNIGNIRAACLTLAIKMYIAYTEVELGTVVTRNVWLDRALSQEHGHTGIQQNTLSDVSGVEAAENDIVCTLKGAIFPVHAECVISVLCKYLILTHKTKVLGDTVDLDGLNARACDVAFELVIRVGLDVMSLHFKGWKVISMCCLMGVMDACTTTTQEIIGLETELMSLMEELRPSQFTQQEMYDIELLFLKPCVVCNTRFNSSQICNALRRLTGTCTQCLEACPAPPIP